VSGRMVLETPAALLLYHPRLGNYHLDVPNA